MMFLFWAITAITGTACKSYPLGRIVTEYDDYRETRKDELLIVYDTFPYDYIRVERSTALARDGDQLLSIRLKTLSPFANHIESLQLDIDGQVRRLPVVFSETVDVDARSSGVNYYAETLASLSVADIEAMASADKLLILYDADRLDGDPVEIGPNGKSRINRFLQDIVINNEEGDIIRRSKIGSSE